MEQKRFVRTSLLVSSLALVSIAGLFAIQSSFASSGATLPDNEGLALACPEDGVYHPEMHGGEIQDIGPFQEHAVGRRSQIMVELGKAYKSAEGLKTVPFQIVSIGQDGFADGLGATRFSLDASRPVTSAIWERVPGTDFPAIQEMRFHFFYQIEALPGKVLRSVNPAIMRSESVTAFPPLPGTVYVLVKPVELEDASNPGVILGRITHNRVTI
jgi:hypothetical protein